MSDIKSKRPFDTAARTRKDDAILARAAAALGAFEREHGVTVDVTISNSVNSGNCEDGVVAWRAKNAGGRTSVPAQEMLQIAGASRDQVSRAVRGVYRAIAEARKTHAPLVPGAPQRASLSMQYPPQVSPTPVRSSETQPGPAGTNTKTEKTTEPIRPSTVPPIVKL